MESKFDHYWDNDELAQQLSAWAEEHSTLCDLAELGRSHENRPIWLMSITNRKTGPATEKAALWLDGNIHATELTGAMACLYTINYLLTGYGRNDLVTRLLDRSVFYVVPRLNPDGAEQTFLDPPHRIRSGTRPYPHAERRDGLYEHDIDGDGRILTIRIVDPAGDWKVSEDDPRLMVKRGVDELGGLYYRLLPEGLVHNYEEGLIPMAARLEGLDFNRNFPFEWAPEGNQTGAGPFPLSEPETRQAVAFVTDHPNINIAITCHTFGGVLLRSYSTKADSEMIPEDLWVYQRLGRRGTELTGYPNVSTFHEFQYHPRRLTYGAFDDWCFDHLGIFAWTVELWDLLSRAGITERKFIEWNRDHPIEDDLRVLAWVDENLSGEGFVPWHPFEHPQLGPVEIGGWDDLFVWNNPPPTFLEEEIAKVNDFVLSQASALPSMKIRELNARPLAPCLTEVTVLIENDGYLSTYTSRRAEERKAVKQIAVKLVLPQGMRLEQGKLEVEIGQLEGRSNKFTVGGRGSSPTDNRAKVQWVVAGTSTAPVEVVVSSERAGTARRTVLIA